MKMYTVTLRHKESRHKDAKVKHCILLGDVYFRPAKYRDGSPEHEPVDDLNETGWEYIPLDLDSTGYYILKSELEPEKEEAE